MERMEWGEDRGGFARPGAGLPAELYLLACDLRKTRVNKRHDVLGNAMRAAVLIELTARGCLVDADGKAAVVKGVGTGVPLLDETVREIAEDKPRSWRMLVERQRRWTLETVEHGLEEAGTIRMERRPVLPHQVEVLDRDLVRQLHVEVADTLNGGRPVAEFPPQRAALAALAAMCQLRTVTNPLDRLKRRGRIKELTRRAGEAGPAIKKLVDSRQIMAVIVAGSISVAGS
jgi:Golgi phosphoprotein 3 (GPP34)